MKRRVTPGKKPGDAPIIDQHPLLFPSTLRHVFRERLLTGRVRHNLQMRVPWTMRIRRFLSFTFPPSENERSPADGDTPWEYFPIRDENGEYRLDQGLGSGRDGLGNSGRASRPQPLAHLGTATRASFAAKNLARGRSTRGATGGEPLGLVRGHE
jgi:hypothetical protein